MNLDLELIRAMVLDVAASPDGLMLSRNIRRIFDGYSDAEVALHFDIVGFLPIVSTTWTDDGDDRAARLLRIRPEGVPLLDLFRDEARWIAAKIAIGGGERACERLHNTLSILMRPLPTMRWSDVAERPDEEWRWRFAWACYSR